MERRVAALLQMWCPYGVNGVDGLAAEASILYPTRRFELLSRKVFAFAAAPSAPQTGRFRLGSTRFWPKLWCNEYGQNCAMGARPLTICQISFRMQRINKSIGACVAYICISPYITHMFPQIYGDTHISYVYIYIYICVCFVHRYVCY